MTLVTGKFCNTHRKTPVPESLSVINLQALRRATLSKRDAKTGASPHPPPPTRLLRPAKSRRTIILKNTFERLPLIIHT